VLILNDKSLNPNIYWISNEIMIILIN